MVMVQDILNSYCRSIRIGSVADKVRAYHLKTSTGEGKQAIILAHVAKSIRRYLNCLSAETGINKHGNNLILAIQKWRLHKLQLLRKMNEDDQANVYASAEVDRRIVAIGGLRTHVGVRTVRDREVAVPWCSVSGGTTN
ncbi:hypothetical protein PR048_017079 [Dryococelus australis]|uniref:Uncharacterized protein n=1 Tax=Dryococelus australis TaxID=614101 RepID=A0ABQ9H8H7_9NEOP|nr:hypothetical protein PR048_017079 [Dryococelus australis]